MVRDEEDLNEGPAKLVGIGNRMAPVKIHPDHFWTDTERR